MSHAGCIFRQHARRNIESPYHPRALAAAADVDPRTVQRHLRGKRIHPALARAIDMARAAIERADDAHDGDDHAA